MTDAPDAIPPLDERTAAAADRLAREMRRVITGCHLGERLLTEAQGVFIAPRDSDYARALSGD